MWISQNVINYTSFLLFPCTLTSVADPDTAASFGRILEKAALYAEAHHFYAVPDQKNYAAPAPVPTQ
jgi:allantoicase